MYIKHYGTMADGRAYVAHYTPMSNLNTWSAWTVLNKHWRTESRAHGLQPYGDLSDKELLECLGSWWQECYEVGDSVAGKPTITRKGSRILIKQTGSPKQKPIQIMHLTLTGVEVGRILCGKSRKQAVKDNETTAHYLYVNLDLPQICKACLEVVNDDVALT